MHTTRKIDTNEFDPDIVIDNHINYGKDYWILTFEDENEDALLQILVHPHINGEDVYEEFYDIARKEYGYLDDGFSMTDKKHRNNAPLYVVDKIYLTRS